MRNWEVHREDYAVVVQENTDNGFEMVVFQEEVKW